MNARKEILINQRPLNKTDPSIRVPVDLAWDCASGRGALHSSGTVSSPSLPPPLCLFVNQGTYSAYRSDSCFHHGELEAHTRGYRQKSCTSFGTFLVRVLVSLRQDTNKFLVCEAYY